MDQNAFVALSQNALWQIILLSTPILVVTMVIGVGISILQAVTQVQESTLTFVPKILVSFLLLALMAPWLTQTLVDYTGELLRNLTDIALAR